MVADVAVQKLKWLKDFLIGRARSSQTRNNNLSREYSVNFSELRHEVWKKDQGEYDVERSDALLNIYNTLGQPI
jgi:hypothetical protein